MLYRTIMSIAMSLALLAPHKMMAAPEHLPIEGGYDKLHYLICLDDNMGKSQSPTPQALRNIQNAIAEKIISKASNFLATQINTKELSTMNLSHNTADSTKYMVMILAHGGSSPYRAGAFSPELHPHGAPMIQQENVEIALFSCYSGSLTFTRTAKAKTFGVTREVPSASFDLIDFWRFLAYSPIDIPQTAFAFYELYARYHHQKTPLSALNVFFATLLTMAPDAAPLGPIDKTLATLDYYYIDSPVGQTLGNLSTYLPLSSLWYTDPTHNLYLGRNEETLLEALLQITDLWRYTHILSLCSRLITSAVVLNYSFVATKYLFKAGLTFFRQR